MRKIVRHPAADKDLEDIWEYISRDNETRATAFIKKLDGKFFALAPYRIIDGGIDIIRVLHGARDLPSLSFDDDHGTG